MEEAREKVIVRTSILGILVNILLASLKIIVGTIAASIAIVSEGINNATDVMSSVILLIGTKLSGKHPDKKHPFGYGRIEYLTSLCISIIIFVVGVQLLISSVKAVFNPTVLNISIISVAVVSVSCVVKLVMGMYIIGMGRKTNSSALLGVGVDCRNDSLVSVVTIISSVVFVLFRLSIDSYAGIIISLFILKTGFDILKETVGDLIGTSGDEKLAATLYREIRQTPGIIGAADMMLHDYGPDRYSGSVNLEIDHKKSVGEIYDFLHALQLRIMHQYGVTMVFGIYAVDEDTEQVKKLRRDILQFTVKKKHIQSIHAVYIDKDTDKIYCDFVVDYDQSDWEGLRLEFLKYMDGLYPGRQVELTIETMYV